MGKVRNIEFEMTWCDYLTPCPHFPDIEVGSYECEQCKYFKSRKMATNNIWSRPVGDLNKYMKVDKGVVVCQKE